MITIKSDKEIEILKEGGKKLSLILGELLDMVKVGVSAFDLELKARDLIKKAGGRPSFLNYRPDYTAKPFPAALCVSVNSVVVHGLPKKTLVFREGDLVTLDIGMEYKGLYTDMAYTVNLGNKDKKVLKLLKTVRGALRKATKEAREGKKLGDVSFIIGETITRAGFFPVCELTGHGVGYAVHEEPYVFNCGKKNSGLRLQKGLVLALEPMAGIGTGKVLQLSDDSFKIADNSLSAHFEQTIAIREKKTEVVTPFLWEK